MVDDRFSDRVFHAWAPVRAADGAMRSATSRFFVLPDEERLPYQADIDQLRALNEALVPLIEDGEPTPAVLAAAERLRVASETLEQRLPPEPQIDPRDRVPVAVSPEYEAREVERQRRRAQWMAWLKSLPGSKILDKDKPPA